MTANGASSTHRSSNELRFSACEWGIESLVNRPSDSPGESTPVPGAESPDARSEEQELAAGRTAATPFFALGSVAFLIACAVAVLIGLVVLAMYLS